MNVPSSNPLSGKRLITRSAGPVGASYAVTENNWRCTRCKAENFARRDLCLRCKAKKPKESGMIAVNHDWREAMDPNSKMIYYFNTKSNQTTWTRPKEMGRAVYNTGFYGRGNNSGKDFQKLLEQMNEEFLRRPAMKQAENLVKSEVAYREGSHEYNIWYNRYAGDTLSNEKSFEPADSRLKVKMHSGFTKADLDQDANPTKSFNFCLYYAQGKCAKGVDCNHFHRLPTYSDIADLEKDSLHDCFGRERHATQRSDMDGVGCFNDASRTLYVGSLKRAKYTENPKLLREIILKHFAEFGELENVNVIWRLSIAFVRFRFRSHAEFAKVAMSQQSLDDNEVIVIRWAYDDPNPLAKEAIKRANADAVVTAIQAAGGEINKTERKRIIGPSLPTAVTKRMKNS